MIWLGNERGYLADWITQCWVRLTGRTIISSECDWLLGPSGSVRGVGGGFFEQLAEATQCRIFVNAPNTGLIEDFASLDSRTFEANQIQSEIKSFYESTSSFALDVWSEWSGVFKPFGRLLRVIFSRRLQQLNVPISPLETSRGISSDIITLMDKETGHRMQTGWLRRMLSSGDVIYAGLYSIAKPPLREGSCLKVVFPLPNGHVTVLMRPEASEQNSLKLHSDGTGFGDAGFYFVARNNTGRTWARYVRMMKESIHTYRNENGELRADHVLKICGLVFLRLHYRITLKNTAVNRANSTIQL